MDELIKAALAEQDRRRRVQNIKVLDMMTYCELLRVRDAIAVIEALGIVPEPGLSGVQLALRLRVGQN